MPAYFLSDVHLRRDRPDRGRRLAEFVGAVAPDASIIVVGDLCDFWFSSRQARRGIAGCPGLESLAAFARRGGALTILAGNHDAAIAGLYRRALGARVEPGPLSIDAGGLRVLALHGHLLGARPPWKGWMEGRAFHSAFGLLPGRLASTLEARLDRSNEAHKPESDRRFLAVYRAYARSIGPAADVVVLGHIHLTLDEPTGPGSPRLVVLGDWLTGGSSHLRVADGAAELVVDAGAPAAARTA